MTRILIPILLALLAPSVAIAQSPPVRLTLADAISRGFETSHRIAEARAREQGARAAVHSAELATKPTVSANAGYVRTNHVDEFAFPQPGGARVVVYPEIGRAHV